MADYLECYPRLYNKINDYLENDIQFDMLDKKMCGELCSVAMMDLYEDNNDPLSKEAWDSFYAYLFEEKVINVLNMRKHFLSEIWAHIGSNVERMFIEISSNRSFHD